MSPDIKNRPDYCTYNYASYDSLTQMPPVFFSDVVFAQCIFKTKVEFVLFNNVFAGFSSVAGPRLAKLSRTRSININWDVLLKLTNKRISQPSATVANHPGNKLGFSKREVLLCSVREWNLLIVSIRRKEIGISSVCHSQIEHAVQCLDNAWTMLLLRIHSLMPKNSVYTNITNDFRVTFVAFGDLGAANLKDAIGGFCTCRNVLRFSHKNY